MSFRCGICSFETRKAYCPPALTPKLFATNDSPDPSLSEPDTLTMRQSLSEMSHELEHLEAEVEFAEAALSRMKAKRSWVQSSIRDYEKTLRPIISVPDDILRLIFEWTVHLCCKWPSRHLLSLKIAPPWTITHTCSRWRALAISHPPLWCNLIVPSTDSKRLLELSLQRSANAECGLAVDIPYRRSGRINALKSVFIPLLEPMWHRCHSFKAVALPAFFNELFCGRPLERLVHLNLKFHHDHDHTVVTSFNNTPRLVHLVVDNLSGNCDLDINWAQLTSYQSRDSNLRFLGRLSAVETLELVIIKHQHIIWEPTSIALKAISRLRLPSLKSLSLLFDHGDDVLENLSGILVAPALRYLYVTSTRPSGNSNTMLCPNIDFLEHVTHLSINIQWQNTMDYTLDFLRRAGRVTLLYLGYGALNAAVSSALRSTDILPFLEHLYIDVQSMQHRAADVFMMVEARHCMLTVIKLRVQAHENWERMLRVELLDKWYSLCEKGTVTICTRETSDTFKF